MSLLCVSDALLNVDQAGFYVEPLSPEYQNDSKTPVRFVRKMVGIYGQVDVLSLLSGERPVFTDKLHELAGFVHVKAEIEFRILSEECLTFRTVSLAKRFPNGVEDIQQESWPGSRRCFEANAGFSGYPTKQLGWKGLKASFSFRLKRFHGTKLLFWRIWYDIKRFRGTKSAFPSGCLKSTCRNEILCTHIQGRKRILDSH